MAPEITQAQTNSSAASSPSIKNRDDPTDDTPLLANSVETGHVSNLKTLGRFDWTPAIYIRILLVALLFTSCGDQLAEYANVKIFESIICYRFYEKQDPKLINIGRDKIGPGAINGVDEKWCKADPVAAELASLLGNQAFFDGLVNFGCILAGWAADRIGRFPFLILGAAGISLRAAVMQFVMYNWQTLDVQWSWLSAVALVPAGGSYFTVAILFIICSDLTEAEERTPIFFRLGAVNMSASLLMPPLAAWLMGFTPWIPTFMGLVLNISCCLLCLLVPETLNYRHSASSITEDEPSAVSGPGWTTKLRGSVKFLTRDWRVPILVASFFVHVPISTGTQLLLQYISKRYAVRLTQATLFVTVKESVHVGLLFIILPYVQTLFLRILDDCGLKKDLYLIRISLILTTIGWIMTGISPNIPTLVIGLIIAALGTGASFLTRAFLTRLLPPHQVGRIFAVIGVVSGIAQMSASPLLAQLFKYGMRVGSAWVGLPFTVIGIASGVLTLLSFLMRLRESDFDKSESSGIDHD